MTVLRQTTRALAATALVLSLAAPAWAVTVRIDFEAFDGTPASGWNTFSAADSGGSFDLIDTTGADSGIDLVMPSVLDNGGAFDGWNDPTVPLPSWAPIEAVEDYVWSNAFQTFAFSGLDPGLSYEVTLVVSRNLSRVQHQRLRTGAGNLLELNWDSQTDGYVAGNVITFSNVTARADGTLDLDFVNAGGSASWAVNAVQIVREPAMLSLLLSVGLVGLVRRR